MGRSTSFLSMDALSSQLDNVKPRDVWRGIRNVSGVGVEQVEAEKKREQEMGIVKWEEDKDVKRCRICQYVSSSAFDEGGNFTMDLNSIGHRFL